MYRRAFARHRTGAALLLGLSLRAPSASGEPAQPDEPRVGTVEGKTAEELPSAAETPPSPAAPSVAPRLIPDEGVAYPEQALGERFYERVEVRSILELDASGYVRSSSLSDVGGLSETPFARGGLSLLPALLSILSPEVKLEQTRSTHEPSARDRFSVFGFGSYDLLGEKRNGILRRLGDAFRPRVTFIW